MDWREIEKILEGCFEEGGANRVRADNARRPEFVGIRYFDKPILGCAAAEDGLLASLVRNEAANMDLLPPKEWLPGAKSVLSFFAPFTEEIRAGNRRGAPSELWQQARITGQDCLAAATLSFAEKLRAAGYAACVPLTDARLRIFPGGEGPEPYFTSNWSERHVAFAAGLGTFSLSKGLITSKGVAGRFSSLITSLPLAPTPRPYSGLTAYCTRCGECAAQCPVGAIRVDSGKDHRRCADYLDRTRSKDGYYGCGRCQCGVPCESAAPGA